MGQVKQYIAVVDESGTRREYRIPEWGTLTVAQWRELCKPYPEGMDGRDALIEDLHRFSGVPKKHLKRLTPGEADKLMSALVLVRTEAEKRASEVAGEDFTNPTTITHEGVTYRVPRDLEHDTVFGQWVDLEGTLQGAETEAEIMAAICAALLVEEGKEYEGLTATLQAMETLPARIAMGLTAFFLPRSERLRSAMARCLARLMMSRLPARVQAAQTSTTGTPSGMD